MRLRLGLLGIALALGGCVQQAVLENDVRSAIWKNRTLNTASDLSLAHAALSAQLVELEALYQRNSADFRVQQLLADGYELMAHGFVELRYLDALSQGDSAHADYELQLRADAERRSRYYAHPVLPDRAVPRINAFDADLAQAEQACRKHDRAAYETELNRLLSSQKQKPEQQLQLALVHALAGAWLRPRVAERCGFPAAP